MKAATADAAAAEASEQQARVLSAAAARKPATPVRTEQTSSIFSAKVPDSARALRFVQQDEIDKDFVAAQSDGADALVHLPFILNHQQDLIKEVEELPGFKDVMKKFTDEFAFKPTASGRGAKVVTSSEAGPLRMNLTRKFDVYAKHNKDLLSKAGEENRHLFQKLREPWFFGYTKDMKAVGPEFQCVGSLKVTSSGHTS